VCSISSIKETELEVEVKGPDTFFM